MCWGSPAVVIEIIEDKMVAKVDFGDGVLRDAVIGISDERISKGDIVVVHAGVIISKLDVEGLIEQINFMKELLGEDAKGLYGMYLNILSLAQTLKSQGAES